MAIASEQEFNIKFVKEVEKYPCLYNFQLADYTRKNITEKAWVDVGKKVNLTRFQCKEKWKNVRTVFVRNIKENAIKKRKPYYLNSFMQFALPFIKTVPPKKIPAQIDYDEDEEELQDTQMKTETSNVSTLEPSSPRSPLIFPQRSLSLSPLSIVDNPESPSLEPPSKIKREPSSVNEGEFEYFTKQARLDMNSELERNPKKMFLLSMMPDLESMSDIQMRVFKRRVMILVDEILGEPSTP